MPNWVMNIVSFVPDAVDDETHLNRTLELREAIKGDEIITTTGSTEVIDFNKIIPMPKDADWYAWSVKNWGTKWNACNSVEIYSDCIQFNTAWGAPLPVLQKLSSMFPDITIKDVFADEDLGENCGSVVYKNGEIQSKYFPKARMAVDFACDVWDTTPDKYGLCLNDDGTDYIYEEES